MGRSIQTMISLRVHNVLVCYGSAATQIISATLTVLVCCICLFSSKVRSWDSRDTPSCIVFKITFQYHHAFVHTASKNFVASTIGIIKPTQM